MAVLEGTSQAVLPPSGSTSASTDNSAGAVGGKSKSVPDNGGGPDAARLGDQDFSAVLQLIRDLQEGPGGGPGTGAAGSGSTSGRKPGPGAGGVGVQEQG